jgi:D-alanine-D-alanine ligase
VLVEAYLPGREFTIGLLGTGTAARVLGVAEILLQHGAESDIYSYDNKKYFDDRVRFRLANDAVGIAASELALAAWKSLGCRDGGRIDVRCDADGNVNFLEANPLAGLHPIDSDLPLLGRLKGVPYNALIAEIVASAASRMGDPAIASCNL